MAATALPVWKRLLPVVLKTRENTVDLAFVVCDHDSKAGPECWYHCGIQTRDLPLRNLTHWELNNFIPCHRKYSQSESREAVVYEIRRYVTLPSHRAPHWLSRAVNFLWHAI